MNMITPQEYTMNNMHQIPDIENNILEVMKTKLKVYDERLVKLEDKVFEKLGMGSCVSDCCKLMETVCLWTLVIMLSLKVFN